MRSAGTRHLVWDWNGTLLHDVHAVVEATNASLAVLGLEPLTFDRYRSTYCQPIRRFYELHAGRVLDGSAWDRMNAAYFESYHRLMPGCGLADGAEELLRQWHDRRRTQSLLSLYPHEHLVPLVRRLGIDRWFRRVDGATSAPPGLKADQLVRHLAAQNLDPAGVVLIGDSLDDAAAAARVGAGCVLYTGGCHDPASLAAVGVPVVDSLVTAVELAESPEACGAGGALTPDGPVSR